MHTFKDNEGRTWTLTIHVTAIRRCRALVGVDLPTLFDNRFEGFRQLLADVVKFMDVVYVLCKEEAEKRGVSDEEFGAAMAGDTIEGAKDAFWEELTDFFPDARFRAGLKKVMEKGNRMMDRLMEHSARKIEAYNPEVEAEKLIASSGDSPESSESTPGPSPSANSP